MQPQSGPKAAATPSPPAHDLILNPKGKKMLPFFHVMISYRVSTEAAFARQMFDRLLLNSVKRIPEVGLSQWPEGFSNDKHRPGHANVFLDQVCLKTGENWKHSEEGGGFVGALLKSLIFVPLLSWKVERQNEDEPESKKKFKGALGDMVARYSGAKPLHSFIDSDPDKRPFCDEVDNVLLELILAMELHAHLKQIHKGASCMYPCLRLFPIVVDNFPDCNQLPDKVSELTYAEASKHLESCGIQKLVKKTVRGVVQYFFDLQGEKLVDLGKADLALDTVCTKIISAVCDVVSKIDPLSFFESKPLCAELHSFLSKRNCSYMTRILAANNITSLRRLSFLTHQNAIYDLAKQCSSVSSQSAVAELTTLTSVIEESRHDEASWLLSARLDRFIDRDASFETVIKSSSGLIISCAQKSWLTIYFIIGVVFLIIGFMSIFSSGPGGNTMFDFVCCVFLFSLCVASVVHSPKRAYVVFCCAFPVLAVSIIAGFCIDFIKNGAFSLDNATKCLTASSQLQTSFRTCAVAQILCGPLLMVCVSLVMFYISLQRQDLAWTTFLFNAAIVLIIQTVFDVSVLGESASGSSVAGNYLILFFLVFVFILTEWMNHRARRKARQDVAKDEKKYQKCWEKLCKIPEEQRELKQLCDENLKSFDVALESAGTVDVLQDCKEIDVLYARTEFINDAFQSLVSLLVEQHENPSKRASSIQELVLCSLDEDHQMIDQISQRTEHKQESPKTDYIQQHTHKHDDHLSTHPSHPSSSNSTCHQESGVARTQSMETAIDMREIEPGGARQRPDETADVAISLRRGPVKLPSRAIAKSYRVYKSQVNRLTDIVRSSVDCSSFAAVNAVVQMLHSVGYVRPIDRSASADSLAKRCIRMIPSAHVPVPESDREHMLKNQDMPTTSPTDGKILEILRVRNRFVKEESTAHSSGGFRDLSFKVKVGFQESSSGAPQFVPVYEHLLAYCCSGCWGSLCILLRFRCRNRWGDPSVKTFVCELQIHHRGMLPSTVLLLDSLDEAASPGSLDRAEDFHKRYVKMRDALAS